MIFIILVPMFFHYIIISFCSEQKVVTNLEDAYSVFSPAVDENSRSYRFNFINDYLIKTYSSDQTYIQLGYSSRASTGAIESKKKITFKNFRIDTQFAVFPSQFPNNGFAIFLSTEPYTAGTEMGHNIENQGIVLKIVTNNKKPHIELKVEGQIQKDVLSDDIYKHKCFIRIENFENVLKVWIKYGENVYKHVFDVFGMKFKKDFYYCLSASNSAGDAFVKIYDVQTYSLVLVNTTKAIKRNGGMYVWIVFLIAVACLVIYLIKRQTRNPMSKL